MDEIMFDCYLKYRKDHEEPMWKKIWKDSVLRGAAIVMFLIILLFGGAVILLCHPSMICWVWVLLTIEIVLGVVLYVFSEKYLIRSSTDRKKKRTEKCREIQIWLKENDFDSKDKIQLFHTRLSDRMSNMKTDYKEKRDRRDRWIQILVIPILLSIIPLLAANYTELSEIFEIIITILFLFGVIYGFASINLFTTNVLYKDRLKEMQDFADIMQDIMDWVQPEVIDVNNDSLHTKTQRLKVSKKK